VSQIKKRKFKKRKSNTPDELFIFRRSPNIRLGRTKGEVLTRVDTDSVEIKVALAEEFLGEAVKKKKKEMRKNRTPKPL